MRNRSWYFLLAALVASAVMAACGGSVGSSSTPPPPPVTVTVTPATPKVNAGLTDQFTATVANTSNTAVTWTVSGGAANGTISATGLYTAPATAPSGVVTITATSQADSSASGSGTVMVLPAIAVTVAPATASVNAGLTQQFTATVANTSNTAVTWTVSGGASNGTISASGLYTAPATPPSGAVTITATSQADSTKSATATVTVAPAITVTVGPATANVYADQTQQFTDTVGNTTDTSVTWQVSGGASNGTISASGLYTAPATPPSGAVTVTATSELDANAIGSAQVTVQPAISVTVTAANPTVNAGLSDQFTATVGPTGISQSVTWQVNGATGGDSTNGTINASGLYTAPATPPAGSTVKVTATSQTDGVVSSAYSLTVAPAVTVSIQGPGTPPSVLVAGATESFTATVANNSNQSVTWEVNGIAGGNSTVGPITSAGVYMAPKLLPPGGGVEITAVAQVDPNAVSPAISITDGWANASLAGNYVFAVQGTDGNGCTITEMGQFNADGTDSSGAGNNAGNITGSADMNVSSANSCTASFTTAAVTGTYVILPDGRGGVQFTSSPEGAANSLAFAIALDANGDARLIEEDIGTAGGASITGSVWVQSSTAAPSGNYVFGEPHEIGLINASSSAWTGTEDNDSNAGSLKQDVSVIGSFNSPDASGRATMVLTVGGTAENYVFYTISASRFEMIRSDPGTLAIGRADLQDNTTFTLATFNGGYVFQNQGIELPAANPPVAESAAGQITANGADGIPSATFTERFGTTNEPNQTVTNTTYALGSGNGEYTVTLITGTKTFAVWMYSATGGEMLEADSQADDQGTIAQQQNGPFTTNALYGEYTLQLNGSPDGTTPVILQGELSALNGELAGIADSMTGGAISNSLYLIGTYTAGATGEASGTLIACSGTAVPTSATACPAGDTQVFTTALDFWIGTASSSTTGQQSGWAYITSGGSGSTGGYWQGTLKQQY